MQRPLLLRPRFSCLIQRPGQTGDKLDITNSVSNGTLGIDQDRITIMTVTIDRQVSALMEFIEPGYVIHWYGGFTDKSNYFTKTDTVDKRINTDNYIYNTDNSEYFRYLFKGSVFSTKINYQKDGSKSFTLTCRDLTWTRVAKETLHFAYPDLKSERTFANKATMFLSDIVKGICKHVGLELGVFEVAHDYEYTLKEQAVQNGQTDWNFLMKLAEQNSCYVWTELDGNDYILNFVQKGKARGTSDSSIEFIWLDRTDEHDFFQLPQLRKGDTVNEISKFKDNQIQLEDIDLEVSQQFAYGQVLQRVTDFRENGETKEILVSYKEDADEIIYYELNQKKVEDLVRNNPTRANEISNMGPMGIPDNVFQEYYTEKRIPKEMIKAMDAPLYGIQLTANIVGNLNVVPFQSYPVYGIGRWSTRDSGRLKYYLVGLQHVWVPGDFITELTFKA